MSVTIYTYSFFLDVKCNYKNSTELAWSRTLEFLSCYLQYLVLEACHSSKFSLLFWWQARSLKVSQQQGGAPNAGPVPQPPRASKLPPMDAQKNQQTDEILNSILPPRFGSFSVEIVCIFLKGAGFYLTPGRFGNRLKIPWTTPRDLLGKPSGRRVLYTQWWGWGWGYTII